MRGIGFARRDGATTVEGYAAPTCSLRGQASSSIVAFDGFPLWAVRGRLSPGSSLDWEAHHGDEGLYVVAGALRVGGRVCPTGGALVIEAGAPATAIADEGASGGPLRTARSRAAPGRDLRASRRRAPRCPRRRTGGHLRGGRTRPRHVDVRRLDVPDVPHHPVLHLGRDGEYVAARHSHSADEILYPLRGDVRFGSQRVEPGDAVAIEGDHRYGFRSGPEGFAFLNYRRGRVPEQTTAGGVPMLEGGRARALTPVNDVR